MRSNNYNDQLLATLIKEGDHSAFEELYATYHQLLYNVAFKYLKDAELAEDAVHETFVSLWTHRTELDPLQGVRNYIFKCLKYYVLNQIRNNKRRLLKNYDILYHAGETHQETESAVHFRDYKHLLDIAINKLSAQKKRIFKMKSEEGLSNEEVAQRLHLSINTVKFQYTQTTKHLKSLLRVILGSSLLLCQIFSKIFFI